MLRVPSAVLKQGQIRHGGIPTMMICGQGKEEADSNEAAINGYTAMSHLR